MTFFIAIMFHGLSVNTFKRQIFSETFVWETHTINFQFNQYTWEVIWKTAPNLTANRAIAIAGRLLQLCYSK